jgi:uncharacterized protein
MSEEPYLSRRSALKSAAAVGAAVWIGSEAGGSTVPMASEPPPQASDLRRQIFAKVWCTSLVDTHEHLCDEQDRLSSGGIKADDWSVLLSHYFDSDLLTAGMPADVHQRFFSKGPSPLAKWKLLAPFWPAVKNTGYGQAVRISMRQLYGVENLSADTVEKVQAGYERTRKPGFYRRILRELGNIESCQVNALGAAPFRESRMPALLMQDISIVGMFAGPNFSMFGAPTGTTVAELSDWHKVIDWWFNKYGRYAVAVKSQNAYSRDIDYLQVPAEKAAGIFRKKIQGQPVGSDDQKALEDHLFWYAAGKATENKLPVKLHTGYYAGQNGMPLSRLIHNAGSACELCRCAPHTSFVFMHICYPYYEELIAVAKHWTNAFVDMCWSWIINPIAAKDFLKKYLVTAPANKILTFGGDYLAVEPVLGHATIARQGIALALSELVEERWLSLDDALELVDPIMHGNARRIFRLAEKQEALSKAPWL